MRRFLAVVALGFLAACGGSSGSPVAPPSGALKLGIVSGNNQTVAAGSSQLGAPVVGQLVRLPDGTLAFRVEQIADRALDLVVPRLGAQTIVNGSPVPGAVVCAVSVDTLHKLVPFTPCTNTDNAGKATFFFTPGNIAGVATAQIRGTLNNSPAVFDTAKATVIAGPATTVRWSSDILLFAGAPTKVGSYLASAADQYGNLIATASLSITAPAPIAVGHDTAFAALPERTVTITPSLGPAQPAYVVTDLRVPHWKISGICSGLDTQVDSQSITGIVDSVRYVSGVPYFFWSGSAVNYFTNHTTQPVTVANVQVAFRAQRPDTLYLRNPPGTSQIPGDVTSQTSTSPLTYTNPAVCFSSYGGRGRFTLTSF